MNMDDNIIIKAPFVQIPLDLDPNQWSEYLDSFSEWSNSKIIRYKSKILKQLVSIFMYFEHQFYRRFSYLNLTPNETLLNTTDIFCSIFEKITMIIISIKFRFHNYTDKVLFKNDPKKWSFNDYCNELSIVCDKTIVKSYLLCIDLMDNNPFNDWKLLQSDHYEPPFSLFSTC